MWGLTSPSRGPAKEKWMEGRNDGSIQAIVVSLRAIGVSSLLPSLILLVASSFIAGITQSGILVVLSEFAVASAQGKKGLDLHGHSLSIGGAIVVCALLLLIFASVSLAASLISSSMSSRALKASRQTIIGTFFGASWTIQSEERLGHVQQLLTVNCDTIASIVLAMASGLQAFSTVFAMLIAAFIVSPIAAVAVLLVGILLVFSLRPFNKLSRRASAQLSKNSQSMATLVTEYTRLTRDFRILGVEEEALTDMYEHNVESALSYRRNRRLGQLTPVLYQTFAFAFIIGGLAVLSGSKSASLASTGAVLLIILRSLTYGSNVQSTIQQLHSYQGFVGDIRRDLERYSGSQQGDSKSETPTEFSITCENVSFSYGGMDMALKDVSFSVPSGKIVGVVGRSGSGKTTLSQLILGLRQASHGGIMIGNVAPSNVAKGHGRSPLAMVAQDPVLLQGSIAKNIAFFRDVRSQEIESVARAAHLHEDIMAMASGYETLVGEAGSSISGGQRQRLAIARALLGVPRVLVLDEPTSALDARSESLVRRTLTELRGAMTIIVISHRLAMVEDCDLLLVLEKGRVADFGSREEVLAREPFQRAAESVVRSA
jgi:ATP-binding cassette, subfamily B, bacterial